MTDDITPQSQQSLPKKDDKKQQPSNGSAPQGANRQAPKKNGPASRSTSISAGAGNPRPSSRSSNRSTSRKPSNAQGAADSGSESANARKNNNSGDGRQRGKSQTGRGGGQQGGGHKKGPSTAQGNRGQGRSNLPKQPSPAPPATSESSDALSSLQRVIADLKTTSPPNPPGNAQSLAAASTLPANAPVFQPGATAFPSSAPEPPPRHRKAASLGASSLGTSMGYSPNLGSMMEDVEDGQGTPIIEEGEIPENAYQTGHQRRSLSQSFNPPRFQALAAQQQEQGEVLGPTGRPQLAPGFMFGARRRPSANLTMGPPINEEDVGFQFPQQNQASNFGGLDDGHRKPDERGDISGIMAEQVSAWIRSYSCVYTDSSREQIAIQNQIEALQQQQQALYQQQLASNQVLSFQTAGLAPGRNVHRRVHSTAVPSMSMGLNGFGGPQTAMGQFGSLGGLGMGLDGQPSSVPRGHGRRHSVNVLNKSSGQPSLASLGFSHSADSFDDGFAPPAGLAGHSRSDSSWRISEFLGTLQKQTWCLHMGRWRPQQPAGWQLRG